MTAAKKPPAKAKSSPRKKPAPKKKNTPKKEAPAPPVVNIDQMAVLSRQIENQATHIATLQTQLLLKDAIIEQLTNPTADEDLTPDLKALNDEG